jgi:hypothetical protein
MGPGHGICSSFEGHKYRCRDWDGLVDRLVWAHRQRYGSVKARRPPGYAGSALQPGGPGKASSRG